VSDFRPCRECKDWNTCLLTESEKHWFGYEHITFCPQHIFFLLRYEYDIRGRAWPVDDEVGSGGSRRIGEASWVKVSLILAELDDRLSKIYPSLKGELLRSECKDPNKDKIEYLSDGAKDALYYVAGKRKDTPFTVWLAKKRYKKYTPIEKCRS